MSGAAGSRVLGTLRLGERYGAAIVLVLLVLAALLADVLPLDNPYDLMTLDFRDAFVPPLSETPSGKFALLGTDAQGREIFSAIIYGLRTSMLVAFLSAAIALTIGVAAGLAAAWFGGFVDTVLMRLVDLQLSLPSILIALILIALFGRGVDKVIFALVAVQWAYYARTVRAAALAERRKEYIEAAFGLQLSTYRILFRHLAPNALPPLVVVAVVQLGNAVALEATLSFLGLGVPVTEPSLGLLISSGYQRVLSGEYWISFFPGFALAILLISLNVLGEQLRQRFDPRAGR